MKKAAVLVSCVLTTFVVCQARADVVTDWNNAALQAIRVDRTAPPRASRNLAILHTAIFDAVNGISRRHETYFYSDNVSASASPEAAASAAARKVLVALHPAHQAAFDSAYATALAAIADGPQKNEGVAFGGRVADAILAWRANDGADVVVPYTPGTQPGDWQPTPPGFAAALLPNWPFLTCFAMENGAQFRPPAPPALSTPEWAADYNQTKEIGSRTSATRTAEQTDIARFWANGAGTVTPPGHWNVIAQDVGAQQGLSMEQNARLFALLNIAEADAAVISWDCKYAYNFWRPIAAIRNGDTDGNDATAKDGAWEPLLATPPFPEYTSGHSTFSGAGAVVLAVFFGADTIPFTTFSEDLPGVSRSFVSFSHAAEESGMSRIYGGIHYMAANRAGLDSGAALGEYVMQHYMRPKGNRSRK
jgi:hypothetical protein